MQPQVAAELQQQRQEQPKHRGRAKQPVVTGYLIGDDSTMRHPRRARRCKGWGSIIRRRRGNASPVIAWCRVCMCGWRRRCPLAPQLYRQQRVCEAEGVPFASKIALMEAIIRTFEPVAGSMTHVLLDTRVSAPNASGAQRGSGDSTSPVVLRATGGCGSPTRPCLKAGAGRSLATIQPS